MRGAAPRVCVRACVRSYKALRGVVHDAELKALLVLERFGEGAAKSVGRQNLLAAVLELSEDALRRDADSEVSGGRLVQDQTPDRVSPSERRICTSPPCTCESSAGGSFGGRCRGATEPETQEEPSDHLGSKTGSGEPDLTLCVCSCRRTKTS